jgi:N utilization substance protein A
LTAATKGFLTYDELSIIEPDDLMEMGSLTEEQANHIVAQAEEKAQEAEAAAALERKRQREQERIDAATREADAVEQVQEQSNGAPEVVANEQTETETAEG